MNKIDQIINKYSLKPHPEGGYFTEIYRSDYKLKSPINSQSRNAITHIYFLLVNGQFSRFHKVLHDEVWNFYEGDSLRLIEFDGTNINTEIIGKETASYVHIVKGGIFQAAQTTGEYSLVGCSVAPGFDFADFSFLEAQSPEFETLQNNYPTYLKLV